MDFLFVYIMEAHAKDEWPLGKTRSKFRQHQTLGERIEAAKFYLKRSLQMENSADAAEIPLAVDLMDNEFNTTFGAWPATPFSSAEASPHTP